ncbi:MAG: TetR/AcrR family transcriptional regulator [Spirochaeta sp.]
MANREIQEQRVKAYFVQAAKQIVRDEGAAAVKVKRVAEEAGYASGTLYNYFRDLNELLFYCVREFFQESLDHALEYAQDSTDPKTRLLAITEAYSSYFLYNPNIYQLAFLVDLHPPEDAITGESFQPEIVRIGEELLQQCVREGTVDPAHPETILGLLANSIHGNLLFFLTGRAGKTTEAEVMEKIRREISWVLEQPVPNGEI